MYNFETFPNRRGSGSIKWDMAAEDVIPMWVADMDISIAPPIDEAIKNRIQHSMYGYPDEEQAELKNTICAHYKKLYDAYVDPEWIVWLPSTMPGLTNCLAMQGGKFMYAIPMYNHIRALTEETGQTVVEVPMKKDENCRFTWDYQAMENALTDEVKTFIICNPHNPVGRMFGKEELLETADFCKKHNLLVACDEIHCELALYKKHIPFFTISDWAAQNSITVSSAGKICNIPGLPLGFAIIPNAALRKVYKEKLAGTFPCFNVLTLEAYKKAYDGSCDMWKDELREHLKGNLTYLQDWVRSIPELKMPENEGTYLAWINCEALKVKNPGKFFLEEAKVFVSGGEMYGDEQCIRLNYGCPRAQLEEVLRRMEKAIEKNRK